MEVFVNSDYLNYKYLVGVSDNYIILSNKKNVTGTWESPTEYKVIYQYIKPSIYTVEGYRTTTQSLNFEEINVTDNNWVRGDATEIVNCGFIILAFVLFLVNATTRFVRRGGILFGK